MPRKTRSPVEMTGLWTAWAVLSLVVCIFALVADIGGLLGGAVVALLASVGLIVIGSRDRRARRRG